MNFNKVIKIISMGADPEYAVFNRSTNQPVIISYEIPGKKAEPFKLTKDISVQPDGVAIEMTMTPSYTKEEFVNKLLSSERIADAFVKNINPDYEIRAIGSAHYPMNELRKHKECMEFGCSPSYCAYTGASFEIKSAASTTLRTFGQHRHVGFKLHPMDENYYKIIESIIKSMDVFLGIPALLLDTDMERRELYGKAGDFRLKQIEDLCILEYRTLSGALGMNKEVHEWIIDGLNKSVDYANNGDLKMLEECEDIITGLINDFSNWKDYLNTTMEVFNVTPFKSSTNVSANTYGLSVCK
jgi:hypothetical protein